jgi:hypothetical protein
MCTLSYLRVSVWRQGVDWFAQRGEVVVEGDDRGEWWW